MRMCMHAHMGISMHMQGLVSRAAVIASTSDGEGVDGLSRRSVQMNAAKLVMLICTWLLSAIPSAAAVMCPVPCSKLVRAQKGRCIQLCDRKRCCAGLRPTWVLRLLDLATSARETFTSGFNVPQDHDPCFPRNLGPSACRGSTSSDTSPIADSGPRRRNGVELHWCRWGSTRHQCNPQHSPEGYQ